MCHLCELGFQPTACTPVQAFTIVGYAPARVPNKVREPILGEQMTFMITSDVSEKLRKFVDLRRRDHGEEIGRHKVRKTAKNRR